MEDEAAFAGRQPNSAIDGEIFDLLALRPSVLTLTTALALDPSSQMAVNQCNNILYNLYYPATPTA